MRYAAFFFAGCVAVYVIHRLTAPNKQTILPPLAKRIERKRDKR